MSIKFFLMLEAIIFAGFYFIFFEKLNLKKRLTLTLFYLIVFYIASLRLWMPGITTYYIPIVAVYYLISILGMFCLSKANIKTSVGLVLTSNFIMLFIYLLAIAYLDVDVCELMNYKTVVIIVCLQIILIIILSKYLSKKKNVFELDELTALILEMMLLYATNFYIMNYKLLDDVKHSDFVEGLLGVGIVVFFIFLMMEFRHIREAEQALKMEQMNRQIELQNKYMESQEQLHILKHDVQHILSTLSDTDVYKNDSKIQEYKKQLSNIAIPIETGNDTLDKILNIKRDTAIEKGIDISCTIDKDIKIPMIEEDLSLLMINLLDNAIDHVEDEKQIKVSIKQQEQYLVLGVDNTIKNEIELTKVKDHLVPSTYKKGFGIKTIINIVDKYDGLIEYKNDNGWLICRVIVNNKH